MRRSTDMEHPGAGPRRATPFLPVPSGGSAHRRSLALCGALLLLSLGIACSGGPAPEQPTTSPVPSQAPSPPPPPPDSGGAEGEGKSEPKEAEDPSPKTLIVLESGDEKTPISLVEAARRERERRAEGDPSVLTITDENLSEHATGEVTFVDPEASSEGTGSPESPSASEEASTDDRNEQYWRQRARELRLRLRRAVDEVASLEEQVAALRTRFYAEDDPYVRDSRIKPAWDRSLQQLRQARSDVKGLRRELDAFLEEGRRAGALPGWLREGIELEPQLEGAVGEEPSESDEIERHRPGRPEVQNEEEQGG